MKIKLDENMPVGLADVLRAIGHDVSTVFEENIDGCDDDRLWDECQQDNRFLVTQDLDFSDIRKYEPGSHFGIMLVRLGNPCRRELLDKVSLVFHRLKWVVNNQMPNDSPKMTATVPHARLPPPSLTRNRASKHTPHAPDGPHTRPAPRDRPPAEGFGTNHPAAVLCVFAPSCRA